ncbi:MAG: asparagine synthase (glutamine-hydrolyzing) [Gammaproteobacteria bacterium]
MVLRSGTRHEAAAHERPRGSREAIAVCGIAGFVGAPPAEGESASRLRAMCDAIAHRGPDDAGYFVDRDVALGMRRLRVIDVHGGRQPVSNEDGTVTVVFNGEIYNHRGLRRQLEAGGHRFRTHSDTEVLVHLFEDFGAAMVGKLHGMFAFALWDSRDRSLLLARDRTGMKPLSYLETAGGLVFCSEIRSLLALGVGPSISPGAVMQYLAFGYVPEPASILEGVQKLPPGSLLTWSHERGIRIEKYWHPPIPEPIAMTESDLVATLRSKLDAAVASHLESEVPLGAFLSGGLDSSTVVALMTRHADTRVRTFSIGFAEDKYDESAAARSVAAELDTEHTALVLRPDLDATLDSIATIFDEPFGDSSAIPMFFVAQLARQSVTVALSGDGGDELFGGYSRYVRALRQGETARPLRRVLSALGMMLPHFAPGRNRIMDMGRSRWGRYIAQMAAPLRLDEGGVARPDVAGGRVRLEDQLLHLVSNDLHGDVAASMMKLDLETYLPGDILTKVDRTSMAVSLEARVPFLDADLVDFALRIPGEMRVTGAQTKRLFRRAIEGIVPASVLSRPKQGFAIPLAEWFRGPLRHRIDALRRPSSGLLEFVDGDAVRRLVREHSVGRRDHGGMLWRLIVLDGWLAALRSGRLGSPPALPKLRVA